MVCKKLEPCVACAEGNSSKCLKRFLVKENSSEVKEEPVKKEEIQNIIIEPEKLSEDVEMKASVQSIETVEFEPVERVEVEEPPVEIQEDLQRRIQELESELEQLYIAKEHNDSIAVEHEAELLELIENLKNDIFHLEQEKDELMPPRNLLNAVNKLYNWNGDEEEQEPPFLEKVATIVSIFSKLEEKLHRVNKINEVLTRQIEMYEAEENIMYQ